MHVLHNRHHQRKLTVIHTTHNKTKEPNLVQLMYSYFNWEKKKKGWNLHCNIYIPSMKKQPVSKTWRKTIQNFYNQTCKRFRNSTQTWHQHEWYWPVVRSHCNSREVLYSSHVKPGSYTSGLSALLLPVLIFLHLHQHFNLTKCLEHLSKATNLFVSLFPPFFLVV